MLSEISKSFTQTFLIGHLLPAILFVAFAKFALGAAPARDLAAYLASLTEADKIADIGVFGLVLALVLVTFNRQLIQIYEGYSLGKLLNIRFHLRCTPINERRRMALLRRQIMTTDRGYSRFQVALAREFPERRSLVLATRFGNTIRAFERYSAVAYGFEAVEGTNRLVPLMEESVSAAIAWAKSRVDFWVNVSFLSLVAPILWWWGDAAPSLPGVAIPLIAGIAASVVAIHLARQAAYEWGVNVKAGIDVTLPKLAETLGYSVPLDAVDQRRFWILLSQHFLLRDRRTLQLLQPFRSKDPPEKRD